MNTSQTTVVGNCPNCNAYIKSDNQNDSCKDCGNKLPDRITALIPGSNNYSADVASSASASSQVQVLENRYWDAYLVAGVTVGIGSTIKVIGFILAGIIALASIVLASLASPQSGSISGPSSAAPFVIVVFGVAYGLVVAFIGYVIGVIVSAQGQVLKATLDNTVGNSPFLTSESKAKVMSLPKA